MMKDEGLKNTFTRLKSKTKTKNKTNTFAGVNQSITPGHHSQWNNYMHKAYSNEICNISKL